MAWLMRRQQIRALHSPDVEFAPFPRLPTELRDKIWEMAMRGNKKCFHVFFFEPFDPATGEMYFSDCTIHNYNCDAAEKTWSTMPSTTKAIILPPNGLGLSQLVRTPAAHASGCWHYLNESMYMNDAGLWSASRGSRLSMTRKHRLPPHHSAAPAAGAPVPASKSMSAAVTGTLFNHEEIINFHIAKQDIVCIQCDWRAADVSQFEAFSASILSAFQGVDHVAVEYDRWMLTDLHLKMSEPGQNGVLATVLRDLGGKMTGVAWPQTTHMPILKLLRARSQIQGNKPKLWFIDLSLTRSRRGHPEPVWNVATREREVWEGRFCNFVEVQLGDWDWIGSNFGPDHRCFPGGFLNRECGAHCLLIAIMNGLMQNGMSQDERNEIIDWMQVEFGVLAMENHSDS